MRELGPQREPSARWPGLLLAGVGIVAAAGLLWAAVDPANPPSERLPAAVAVAVAAAELAAVALGIWTLSAAPRRLDYRLRGRGLVITQLFSQRRVPLASVASVEILEYDLGVAPGAHLGWPRSYLPGYYVGWWRIGGVGRVRVAVASRRATGVLLRFERGAPLLVAPLHPEAFTAQVERIAGRARR